ncbi:COP9 signalosome complex subunit 3-like [Quercus lobata]|uniref:COP9 signalosome complex subunit 3-like n=1 Tax=Quercus lobata TaxID=97700 RepID=UPI001247C885|nr:COP9 signalosome complex subunit 3-like [Quercus lobata]
MICIGQQHFRKALELLHNVVTAPMSTLNFISVETYKKYLLVSLINHGQFSSSLPKCTSSAAWRNLKSFYQGATTCSEAIFGSKAQLVEILLLKIM